MLATLMVTAESSIGIRPVHRSVTGVDRLNARKLLGPAPLRQGGTRGGGRLLQGVLRTEATHETDEFLKVLVGATDDRIPGFTMIGADASEAMAIVQTAMLADLPFPRLRDAVLTHLTAAEGLGPLLARLPAPSV